MQNKRNGDNSMGEELSQARRSSHDTTHEQGSKVWSKQLFVLYKSRYNGNLCARSVQQAKAASSMMICTLSALAEYFLSTTVLCARNVSPTAYFLPTAAKSMKKCRQKPMVSGLPLPSRGLLVMGPSRELNQQQTRCRSRSGEENISFTAGSTDSPGRTVSFFN